MRKYKVLRCYSTENEKVLLDFYPFKNEGLDGCPTDLYEFKGELLVVYKTDYDKFLLKYLKQVFPLPNPVDDENQECFDVCWDNWIDLENWYNIVNNIKKDIQKPMLIEEKEFYIDFIDWIIEQLDWADLIVVEGNQ